MCKYDPFGCRIYKSSSSGTSVFVRNRPINLTDSGLSPANCACNTAKRIAQGTALGAIGGAIVGGAEGGLAGALGGGAAGTLALPFAYLRDILERISTLPVSRLAELLPDKWLAARQTASTT